MPIDPKTQRKSVQERQDDIFRSMSAGKKLKVAAKLWLLARELDRGKVDFREYGRNRPAPSFDKSLRNP